MKKIAVVVSSYCGLSKEFVESNDLFYLPLQLIVDDKQWLEGCYNQDEEDKIIKLLNDAEQYQTSLPPLAMITEQMEKLSQEYENVLYITISSHLSSTHDALANEAKKYKNVHIFNNHLSGSALFNVAKKAKEMIEQENKSIEQVLAFLKDFNDKTIGFIVPNGLKEFIKSGRLKGIKKMLMTSINLTLMIEVGPELKTAGVARTKKSAVNKVIEKIWEFAQENKINLKESMISIIWAYEPTIKEIMVQQIQDQKTKLEFVIEKASVVTRMHTGLGAAYIGINPKIK